MKEKYALLQTRTGDSTRNSEWAQNVGGLQLTRNCSDLEAAEDDTLNEVALGSGE